jgi:HKD family nuclease
MRINFIGQGLYKNEEINVGKIICSTFSKPNYYNNFKGIVAFATNSGFSEILPYINDHKEKFNKIKFYIGVNDQVTTSEVLQSLLDNEIETYIFYIDDKLFHPKIYMFDGLVRNKIIIGSSNFTKPGLFNSNIESSVVIDFNVSDSNGMKLKRQIETYYQELFDQSHSNIKLLTAEYLNELNEKEIVLSEKFWLNTNRKYENKSVGNLPKRKKRRSEKLEDNLGNLEDDKLKSGKSKRNRNRYAITPEYLRTWSYFYDELKKFKLDNNGSTIVPKTHPDNALFLWYNKQKYLYNHKDNDGERLIPLEHEKMLNDILFYWENGNKYNNLIKWEQHLQKCIEYCKDLPYVWVTWEKKDKNFPLKRQAEWCWEQRMRLNNTLAKPKPLSKYEIGRLEDSKFLKNSDINGGSRDDDGWNTKFAKLVEYKEKQISLGNEDWVPQQKDKDPVIADLGEWYADQLFIYKKPVGTKNAMPQDRRDYFKELGVDENYRENKAIRKFEKDVKAYLNMRTTFKNANPIGEDRKGYETIINWPANQRVRFNIFPDWRKKRLIELGIVKIEFEK